MTEVQLAAMARAGAQIARAQDWIEIRLALYRMVNAMDREILVRLARVADRLTPDELLAALGYAEGLAAWSWVGEQSQDATLKQEDPQAVLGGQPRG